MSFTPSFALVLPGQIFRTGYPQREKRNIKIMKNIKKFTGILILTASFVHQIHAQIPSTNGLVAYYPFNGNANDLSGNGNNGSFVGSDIKYVLDRIGNTNSLWINSTSAVSYVLAPRSSSLDFNTNFTLSIWLKFTNSPSSQRYHNLISNGADSSSANLRYATDYTTGKDLIQLVWGGPNSDVSVVLNSLRQTWFQITAVRSGTNLTIYKNGGSLTNGFVKPTVNNSTILFGNGRE